MASLLVCYYDAVLQHTSLTVQSLLPRFLLTHQSTTGSIEKAKTYECRGDIQTPIVIRANHGPIDKLRTVLIALECYSVTEEHGPIIVLASPDVTSLAVEETPNSIYIGLTHKSVFVPQLSAVFGGGVYVGGTVSWKPRKRFRAATAPNYHHDSK